MIERPEYRVLVPGQKYFICEPLRATLSTRACASNWQAAPDGSACRGCQLGRAHYVDLNPRAPIPARQKVGVGRVFSPCPRCGGSGLRIIKQTGCCVSCMNREYEWAKGRNSKGVRPALYKPPHLVEVGLQHSDGQIEVRAVEVLHGAEALGRVLRDLPGGARVVDTPRPGPAVFNLKAKAFEYQCRECRSVGLVLERCRGDVLERRCWSCNPDVNVTGWRTSPVRQPMQAMHVDAAAEWLSSDPELKGETLGAWTPTANICACGTGQIEGLLTRPGGRWRTRCSACGATSAEGTP